jgi:hypothetical protein
MKSRTYWKAALRGRPSEWTSDDLDEARTETKDTPPRSGIQSSGETRRSQAPISEKLRATRTNG